MQDQLTPTITDAVRADCLWVLNTYASTCHDGCIQYDLYDDAVNALATIAPTLHAGFMCLGALIAEYRRQPFDVDVTTCDILRAIADTFPVE